MKAEIKMMLGGWFQSVERFAPLKSLTLGVALVLSQGLTASMALANDRPVVMAQNYPLAYFAERLAADAADVQIPSPAEADPADWAPDLSAIERLQGADLILLNGRDYAEWATTVALPRARLVDTTAAFRDQLIEGAGETHKHGPEGAHSHAEAALHTWLDFGLAAEQAAAIKGRLRRLPGLDAAEVEERWESLANDLRLWIRRRRRSAKSFRASP